MTMSISLTFFDYFDTTNLDENLKEVSKLTEIAPSNDELGRSFALSNLDMV